MPKVDTIDRDRTSRRKGAAVAESPAGRGFLMRALLHSPKDVVAGAAAAAAVFAIIANAIFMQAGRHPSPMFGPSVIAPLSAPIPNPLPRPRPSDASVKPLDSRMFEARPVDGRADAKPAGAEATPAIVKATASPAAAPVARPPAPVRVSTSASSRGDPLGDLITNSRRIASVQRALTEFGYGQLKPTGTVGSETQAAIQKFERERKMPVTGHISDRLVRELTVMTGRPID